MTNEQIIIISVVSSVIALAIIIFLIFYFRFLFKCYFECPCCHKRFIPKKIKLFFCYKTAVSECLLRCPHCNVLCKMEPEARQPDYKIETEKEIKSKKLEEK